jgi:hypothetical protein
MKILFHIALGVLVFSTALWAASPELETGVKIKDGMVDLAVNLYSAPTCVDWNNDGAKDLVVGQFWDGWVLLYLNKGTNLNPSFDGGTPIESSGSPITVTWG